MVSITFAEADGRMITIEARPGQTLMEAATKGGIDGIVAECGGNCACGTCRCYPGSDWQGLLGPVSEIEADMLDFREDREPGARLACRIMVRDDLDGMTVRLPASQQ